MTRILVPSSSVTSGMSADRMSCAPSRHPLHIAGGDRTLVAETVTVIDGPREHVGDRLDAAVRMPGKAGQIIVRVFAAEVVEQQEGVEIVGFAETERPAQVNAGAFDVGLRLDELFDRPNRHWGILRVNRTGLRTWPELRG